MLQNPEPASSRSRPVLRGHIWLLATLIPLLEKFIPLKWWLRLLTPPPRFKPYAGTPPEEISRLVAHRLREPRNMRRRACLRQGLTSVPFPEAGGLAGGAAHRRFSAEPRQPADARALLGDAQRRSVVPAARTAGGNTSGLWRGR